TARKQTGSFYTPREIVNYMVDESLIAYLKNNVDDEPGLRKLFSYGDYDGENPFNEKETNILLKAIDNCKILDPACGSGAFPMGVLQKMIHILHKLDPNNSKWFKIVVENFPTYMQDEVRKKLAKENWNYVRKLGIIQQCIYGVDIQPIATQIAKLRFFISLLVDQKEKPGEENRGFEPLPNLDFKIVTANTLIPAPTSDEVTTGLFTGQVDTFFEEFDTLTGLFFSKSDPQEKKELKNKITRIIKKKCEQKIKEIESKYEHTDEKASKALKEKYKKFIEEKEREVKLWKSYPNLFKYASVEFFEPKYFFPKLNKGFNILIGNPPYLSISKCPDKELLSSLDYKTYEATGDMYSLFYERGSYLMPKNGVLCYITSRQWINANYGASTRKFFAEMTNPMKLIDFGKAKIFESATVFVNIMIYSNDFNQNQLKACLIKEDFDIYNGTLYDYFTDHNISLTNLNEKVWKITEIQIDNITQKIESIGTPLLKWDSIGFYRGITSGLNVAFHINEDRKNELVLEDPRNKEIIKPLLRGKDIKRYNYTFENWYIINTHNGIKELHIKPINARKDYPSIFKHLEKYKNDLQDRDDQGVHWSNLRNCAFLGEFEKEKIVWLEISDKANYAFDINSMYLTNSAYFMSGKYLKYILSVLNSKLSDFYFNQITAKIAGGRKRYTKQYVEQIPIKIIQKEEQEPFNKIVDIILFTKSKAHDTTFFESLIDAMVYELYFPEEIKVADSEIIKHIVDLPELKENWSDKKKIEVIDSVYKELSDPSHPVSIAMAKMQEIEEVKIIEGRV
ncbi:MAG: TaqI-like C-terminal specificity domain-containing protein, partial [Bacteroidales bacterium]